MIQHVRGLFRTFGWSSFYQGLGPSLIQIFPYMGLNFYFYSKFKSLFEREDKIPFGLGPLVAGGMSGLLSKSLIFPLDVLKRLQQVQRMTQNSTVFSISHNAAYKRNIFEATKNLIAQEGMTALWKGFTPAVLKSVVASASTFYFQSLFKNILSERRQD